MASLWGGRFTKETKEDAFSFNESLSFDKRLWREDIEGSIAHAKMLAKQLIIGKSDGEAICGALESIYIEIEEGTLQISGHFEDIHSFIETQLIQRIGDVGKKLHTGRSRNDQVAVDMKMYVRREITEIDSLLKELLRTILRLQEENLDIIMPGFTHLQKAQPVTLAHHLGAYFEMFKRDRERLFDAYRRLNVCPLGAGALAGTEFSIDREYTASLLHFSSPTLNSMDSVSDRDYCLELLSALSICIMHLSRFCEEIIIWNSNDYNYLELDDAYSTGSSIMPQKKNPDIAELIRGKTGRVYGNLFSLLTTLKGLPLAYNKDLQEDKECVFDACDTLKTCITLFTQMLDAIVFNEDVLKKSAEGGFINATDVADYLVTKGLSFRDAHEVTGKVVLECQKRGIVLSKLPLADYQAISDRFKGDLYQRISIEDCVRARESFGGPAKNAMKDIIKINKDYLEKTAIWEEN
ncbi:MAG: argininosuccinate lyase [Lachnospiraceae bacterium]|jgi:argininosuccinate lyase|nr:argininosuccinate lyase [Lachnospiraceae bacterium]